MFNRLRKLLGYHVCESFTRWEVKHGDFIRLPQQIEFVKVWQQRTCNECGKIEQEDLIG